MGERTRTSPAPTRNRFVRRLPRLAALAGGAAIALGAGTSFAAQSIGDLNSRIATARDQAQGLAAQIDATSAELASAQQEAIVAAQREAQLSAVLAAGQERERRLEGEVAVARHQ